MDIVDEKLQLYSCFLIMLPITGIIMVCHFEKAIVFLSKAIVP